MRPEKMSMMRWTFRILVICGCWQPPSWTSPVKMFLYTLYRAIVLSLVYTVTFLQFMDIVINVQNQDEFSDNFYLLLAMLVSCHKGYSLVKNRESIAALTDILEQEPFLPENAEEIGIRTKFDKRSEVMTLLYGALIESTCICISLSALLRSETGELPYRMWLPGNVSSVYLFSLTYVQQVLALFAGSLMHVACDCLICGLLMHTYSQIEILGSRLKTIKNGENKSLISCVRYHERVYGFAKMLNAKFTMVIFVQFAVSTLAVCFNLYLLTTTESVNAQLLKIIMYTCCILTQIFAYCWCGNEVKSKSLDLSDTIFGSDWTMLDNNAKKVLMVIMRRATVPIEFTSIHIVPMNLETFVSILKTSYSAYNVLQRDKG